MKCNKECQVYSRIVGYWRPISLWNTGKQEEFRQRKVFKVPLDHHTTNTELRTTESKAEA